MANEKSEMQRDGNTRVTVTMRDKNWVIGTYGDYKFVAKVYDEGSKYGIGNGRISKLSLFHIKKSYGFTDKAEVVSYDRGWDSKPEGQDVTDAFEAVRAFLENMPTGE